MQWVGYFTAELSSDHVHRQIRMGVGSCSIIGGGLNVMRIVFLRGSEYGR